MVFAPLAHAAAPRFGLWFNGPRPAPARIERTAAALTELADVVSISLNAGTKPLHRITWERSALIDFTAALQTREVRVEWMTYPVASEVDRLGEALAEFYGSAGRDLAAVPPLEHDVETQAAEFDDADALRLLDWTPLVPVRLNAVLDARGRLRRYVLPFLRTGRVWSMRLQAYTAYKGPGHWTDPDAFRPGGSYAHTNVKAIPALEEAWGVRVDLGQALYAQNHPRPHARGRAALEATRTVLLPTRRDIQGWQAADALADAEVATYCRQTCTLLREAA